MDINPVAWFIQKCTLEYPQRMAGKTQPLPEFILNDEAFMNDFYKAHPHLVGRTKKTKQQAEAEDGMFPTFVKADSGRAPKADLAWHVRAWGRWVLKETRKELGRFYPTYADFEPLDRKNSPPYERREMILVSHKTDGTPDVEALNRGFTSDYLDNPSNPRWIAKPAVAYLWARTVTCKNCRATIPLLKTRWLCKKENKRVLLTVEPNAEKTGVVFGIENCVPSKGGNVAQKREHDKRIAAGTMSKSGARCPCCGLLSMTTNDLRLETTPTGSSAIILMAVVAEGQDSKEYRPATEHERTVADLQGSDLTERLRELPNATLMDTFAPCSTRSISAHLYGVRRWADLYTVRQAVSIATLGKAIHQAFEVMKKLIDDDDWQNAITNYLCLGVDRFVCFQCVNVRWKSDADSLTDAFSRFSISLLWDFAEAQPLGTSAGSYIRCNERIATALDTLISSINAVESPIVINGSAMEFKASAKFDAIVTDPPY